MKIYFLYIILYITFSLPQHLWDPPNIILAIKIFDYFFNKKREHFLQTHKENNTKTEVCEKCVWKRSLAAVLPSGYVYLGRCWVKNAVLLLAASIFYFLEN